MSFKWLLTCSFHAGSLYFRNHWSWRILTLTLFPHRQMTGRVSNSYITTEWYLFAHLLRDFLTGDPDRLTAILREEFSFRELGRVDLLRERVHAAVHLVVDAGPLDGVLCRDFTIAFDLDQRDRCDLRVFSLLLEVAERDIIEGCVGGHTHDHAGRHVGVDKVRGKDRDSTRRAGG